MGQCSNCQPVIGYSERNYEDLCYIEHFLRYELDERNSLSPEDWQVNNASRLFNFEKTGIDAKDEEEKFYLQNGRASRFVASYLNPEASEFSSQSGCREKGYENNHNLDSFSYKKFERKILFSNESVLLDSASPGGYEKKRSNASSASSSSRFMSPQEQIVITTSGSGNSPGRNMISSSPGSDGPSSVNNFPKVRSNNQKSPNNSNIKTKNQQSSAILQTGITIVNNCSYSECDVADTILSGVENGGMRTKMSCNDTIYPWMKESRQTQKKRQSNNTIRSGIKP